MTAELATVRAQAPTTGPVQPTGRALLRWILVLGALVALGPLTIDMYLPALPTIAADLGTSAATVQLTLTGTLFGLAVGQLVIGPLSDVLGRKRPMLVGTVVHVLASLACIVAPNVAVLAVLRILQGAGAAAAAVVAMAVVRDLFQGRAAATVLSRLMLVMGVAPVLAPTLGGILLTTVSWRGVFGALALVGVALLVVGAVLLPETLPPEARRGGGLAPALRTYAALLRDREFVALVGVAGLAMSALFAYVAGSSFVFQEEYALDQQQFAYVFAAGAVALIGASQVNVRLLARRTPQQITLAALVGGVVLGALLVVVAATGFGGLVGLLVPLWLFLGTVGLVLPNAPALALSRHGEAAGTAAALLGAVQFGFGALVSPAVGLLGNNSLAMAAVMLGGAALALVALLLVLRRTPAVAA